MFEPCVICGLPTPRNAMHPSEEGLLCEGCAEMSASERERLTVGEADVDPEGL